MLRNAWARVCEGLAAAYRGEPIYTVICVVVTVLFAVALVAHVAVAVAEPSGRAWLMVGWWVLLVMVMVSNTWTIVIRCEAEEMREQLRRWLDRDVDGRW